MKGLGWILLISATAFVAGPEVTAQAAKDQPEWEATALTESIGQISISGETLYALARIPSWSGRSAAGPPGTLWRSPDRGSSWERRPLPVTYVNELASDPSHSAVVYVAGESGVWRSGDAGQSWANVLRFSDGQVAKRVVVSQADPSIVYAGTAYPFAFSGAVWRSLDGGLQWERAEDLRGELCTFTFPLLDPDPVIGHRLYAAVLCSPGRGANPSIRVSDDYWTSRRTILSATPSRLLKKSDAK